MKDSQGLSQKDIEGLQTKILKPAQEKVAAAEARLRDLTANAPKGMPTGAREGVKDLMAEVNKAMGA